MIGLAAAVHNRCIQWFLTGNSERFIGDLERVEQIAREYGFPMSECNVARDLAEVNFVLGRMDEALRRARRAAEMFRQQLGGASRRGYTAEVQMARIAAYQGDRATAEEIVARVVAEQAEAKTAGRNDVVLLEAERILLDGVDAFLRGEVDATFDALIARGRELQLQNPDIVELIEWKGLSAVRAGRTADGMATLQEALAAAQGTMALERVQRRIAGLTTGTASPRLAGSAS
jgi:hypothetical protein